MQSKHQDRIYSGYKVQFKHNSKSRNPWGSIGDLETVLRYGQEPLVLLKH